MINNFKRKFSLSMYKNLKLKLCEMSFATDFVSDGGGDLYPVLFKSDDLVEKIECNRYKIEKGTVKRFVCQFFPFATYELTASTKSGSVGFAFELPDCSATVLIEKNKVVFSDNENNESIGLPDDFL